MLMPNAIVLGRGLELLPDGSAILSPDSLARVDRMTREYYALQPRYDASGLIVVSGGHPRLADEVYPKSEADLMADVLMENGVPSKLIEKEPDSTSTLGNFLNSYHFFKDRGLGPDNWLTVVTHRDHMRRSLFFGRMVMGNEVGLDVALAIPTGNPWRRVPQELAMETVWRAALMGIKPGDREALQAREDQVHAFAGSMMRPLLQRVIK